MVKSLIRTANIKKHEAYDLYIGRENKWLGLDASPFANRFHMKNESQRPIVLQQFYEGALFDDDLLMRLPELHGKVLGCYCGNGRVCHGNILADLFEDVLTDEMQPDWELIKKRRTEFQAGLLGTLNRTSSVAPESNLNY